jgi:uroporphyrinogen decarboxylase
MPVKGNNVTLSHHERMQACLLDDPALDRPPVALWRHFPVDDQSPEQLASSTLAFQNHFDFDVVKVTPASSFCIKDWGAEDTWEGNPEGTRRYTNAIICSAQDWEHLPTLDPHRSFFLSAQLKSLKLIRASFPPETPIIQTVFSPLSQAKNMVGTNGLAVHIRKHPDAVQKGLEVIAETTRRFVEAAMDQGIDGIFYAIQHARATELTREEYGLFGLPHDQSILGTASSLWCNILHLHGLHLYWDICSKLTPSASILNWHDRETAPSLAEAQSLFHGVVCGGVSQNTIVYKDAFQVEQEAQDALLQTHGRKFILGTGCVVPVIAPYGNLNALRHSVEADR